MYFIENNYPARASVTPWRVAFCSCLLLLGVPPYKTFYPNLTGFTYRRRVAFCSCQHISTNTLPKPTKQLQ